MSNANLFRPPPPPPRPATKRPDPLVALSKPLVDDSPKVQLSPSTVATPAPAPTPVPATTTPAPLQPEELTDLSDEDMELWAVGGTRIMSKPTSTPSSPPVAMTEPAVLAETMKSTDLGPAPAVVPAVAPIVATQYQALSYPPVAMTPSVSPPPVKKSNTMMWLLAAGLTGLVGLGVVGAGVGLYVYRTHQAEELSQAAAMEETHTSTSTDTSAASPDKSTAGTTGGEATTPQVAAATAAPEPRTTTQPHVAAAAEPPPVVRKSQPAEHVEHAEEHLVLAHNEAAPRVHAASSSSGSGTIRTFAAGSGKAVFVDGHLAGIGPGPLKATCGRHTIVVGESKARTFNVPCDGSTITVGSPDGT
jgi:hypothetical protein